MPFQPDAGSRALWRTQAVLSGLVAVALLVFARLLGLVAEAQDEAVARARLLLPGPDTTGLVVALVASAVLAAVLLVAACLHVYRIATLTFRRGDE